MKIYYSYIASFLVVVASVIGMFRLKSLEKHEYLILTLLCFIILTDMLAIYPSIRKENTSIYYNILVPVQVIFTLITYYWYMPSCKIKRLMLYCIILFGLFTIVNGLLIQDIFLKLASYTFFIGGIMVVLFSYILWRQQVDKMELSPTNLILWFATANFLYYGSVVPVASANNWLVLYSSNLAFPVHTINLVMYGLWASVIGFGFIWKRKPAR